MPEYGRYEKKPRPESVAAFSRTLESHKAVTSLEVESDQVLIIHRKKHSSLKAFLTNIYTIGAADIDEILAQNPDINLIVSVSSWNSYSSEAKAEAANRNVGLFTFGEALGAIHYVGERFINYTPPDPRERRSRSAS